EAWGVLQTTESEVRSEIFAFFPPEKQLQIVETRPPEETSQLIIHMRADDRVDLLKQADSEAAESLLAMLPQEERRDILRLSEYPEGTAGSLMTTDIARLPESLTVREALDEVARQAEDHETIYYIYIVDNDNHLRGLVSARQLVTHLVRPRTPISELMERNLVTVEATDDQEKVAAKVAAYDFLAIPVVDHEQHLVGIITHDDVIDVLRAEAHEDALLAGGVGPLQQSYLNAPLQTLAWKRGVWLAVLMLGALLTVLALRSHEDTLQSVGWLAFFLPLIISCGGNSGGQSATLVITAMTAGSLAPKDWGRVIRRELTMGAILGTLLGAMGFAYALVLVDAPFQEKLVIPATLWLVVVAGALCGGTLPLLFRRLGLDPALMSTPFVAGIIDVAGILIYMSIAWALLASLRTA
ncbi:MAG: magnesium transporter, partial [Planctomycetales bacterium]|nr:magnesium transporter [Planctomycetales bacterium]